MGAKNTTATRLERHNVAGRPSVMALLQDDTDKHPDGQWLYEHTAQLTPETLSQRRADKALSEAKHAARCAAHLLSDAVYVAREEHRLNRADFEAAPSLVRLAVERGWPRATCVEWERCRTDSAYPHEETCIHRHTFAFETTQTPERLCEGADRCVVYYHES